MSGFYEGTSGQAEPVPHKLATHEDVVTDILVDKAQLSYDQPTSTWRSVIPIVPDLALNDLNNVTTAPNDDDVLSYDAASSTWVAASISAGAPIGLGGLTDVTLTAPSGGNYLTFDGLGGQWRNTQPIPASGTANHAVKWDAGANAYREAESVAFVPGGMTLFPRDSDMISGFTFQSDLPEGGWLLISREDGQSSGYPRFSLNTAAPNFRQAMAVDVFPDNGIHTQFTGADFYVGGGGNSSGAGNGFIGVHITTVDSQNVQLTCGGGGDLLVGTKSLTVRGSDVLFLADTGNAGVQAAAGELTLQAALAVVIESALSTTINDTVGVAKLSVATNLAFPNIPTSTAGLSAGDVYRVGSNLQIVE
jgi:hypothetical protein